MKLSHLKQICLYLKQFKQISSIYRVDDNIIKAVFDKGNEIYFDLTKSNSKIFKTDKNLYREKLYNAPFDIALSKKINKSKIQDVFLVNDDKILRFECMQSHSYKKELFYLQFEFTGKHTNIIILDKDEVVIEALRHIDIYSSYREVKVGHKLLPLKKKEFVPKEYPIDDIEQFLYDEYKKDYEKKLQSLKTQKLSLLKKNLDKLLKRLDELEDENELLKSSEELFYIGNLVLSNLHNIKPYQKEIELTDYDGSKILYKPEKLYENISRLPDDIFSKAKRLRQKAKNLHIEKESLLSKIEHIKRFMTIVEESDEIDKIELLFPKKQQSKKEKTDDNLEVFYVEGYKILLGKNEKGNIKLLKDAKAKDIWFHLKDMPSAHVLVKTDKQNIPQNVLEFAAKLCVEFSTTQKGSFLVDYTKRQDVKAQEGANVLYYNYKTIKITR